jgi:hypothetical protein
MLGHVAFGHAKALGGARKAQALCHLDKNLDRFEFVHNPSDCTMIVSISRTLISQFIAIPRSAKPLDSCKLKT